MIPAGRKTTIAYLDPALPVDVRLRDLMARMTLEEKLRQMSMISFRRLIKDGRVPVKVIRKSFGRMSIGCLEDPRLTPSRNVELVNSAQGYLVKRTRLGIPALVVAECLHGHMSGGATIFPQGIGLASTWNPRLIRQMAQTVAKEARAVGVTQALAPDLDLARDPRWGRVEETYGEDPYLVSKMGLAYINGMQGGHLTIDREHLICTAKHYAAHGSPESGLNIGPVYGGMRELRTLYLPPFKAAVTDAGVLSIMPAYSEYDGVPASASKLLLTHILREDWGFAGYVFSDYGAVAMLQYVHRTARTPGEAGKQALLAGMDLEAPADYCFGKHLLALVKKGEVSMDLIDQAVARILRVKFLAGLFENPYADAGATKIINSAPHRKLARRIAQESIVLLKNEKRLLPLDRNISSIAVIGPNADTAQMGDYTIPDAKGVTPLQGIRDAVSKRTKVLYASGCGLFDGSRKGFDRAVALAKKSDVAVVLVGGTSHFFGGIGWGSDTGAVTCGEGFDRNELGIPGVQEDLVRAVYETRTPTVVVMIHGRPYTIAWMVESIPAIIEAWYPGQEGGYALADVLFGRVNPSGKLPVSVPRSVGHLPCFYNHKPSARGYYHRPGKTGTPGRDYVFDEPTPLFSFGYGLSYTTFKYSNLRVSPRRASSASRVNVAVNVHNTGGVAGKEVVQLYVNDLVSSVSTPVKALRRFQKVFLRPSEQTTVEFSLGPEDLAVLDENMTWTVEPGEFEVMVADLKKTFSVV